MTKFAVLEVLAFGRVARIGTNFEPPGNSESSHGHGVVHLSAKGGVW
jgi:hypothetical protein